MKEINGKKWGNKPEWAAVLIYAAALVFTSIYHEPWFDEAQAWQIAKCASLSEILFTIPHLEGHPPLWHLILAVPAKLGVPYEVGLKLTGFLISVSSVLLIEFRAPFPRWIRLLLPFNYFIFYQYGVIVRPYSLMLLAFIFTAMAFEDRNIRPGRFTGALAFLCSTMAYGIVFAGGIAACWLYEIFLEKDKRIGELIRDKRIHLLVTLLIFALLLIGLIIPESTSVGLFCEEKTPVWLSLICTFATLLSNTFITSCGWMVTDSYKLQNASVGFDSVFPAVLGDMVLWALLLGFSSRKNRKYLVIPFALFAVFTGTVYFSAHHVGAVALFLIFWAWINISGGGAFETGREWLRKLCGTGSGQKQLKKLAGGVLLLCLLIPVSWSIRSAVLEVKENYWYGRDAAAYLQENGLEGRTIAAEWYELPDAVDEDGETDYGKIQTMLIAGPVPVVSYFDCNIVYNLNQGRDDTAYRIGNMLDAEANRRNVEQWRENSAPEVLLDRVNVELLTDGEFTINDYIPVYCCRYGRIWKGTESSKNRFFVYVRKDVAEELDLDSIPLPEGMNSDFSLKVSDEVKEAYENGEDYQAMMDEQFDFIYDLNDE